MQAIEIIVIIAVALIFIAVIGSFIYKKIHHLPTGECDPKYVIQWLSHQFSYS